MVRTLWRSCRQLTTTGIGLFVISSLFAMCSTSQAMEHIQTEKAAYDFYNLNAFVSYQVDTSRTLALDDVLTSDAWVRNTAGHVLNFGFVDFAVWLKLRVNLAQYSD